MGQTVGGYRRNRRRESFSSCVSNFDSATSSSNSLKSQKANTSSNTEDDVTQSLFPYTTSANSPSNSDEPSMSSSIIETSSVKEGTHHVAGLASKIIPKRAWSGYHLFQLANMRGERINSSPRVIRSPKIRPKSNTVESSNTTNTGEEDIDQLITMMKNHKVSDDSPFDFNFNNQAKPLTPQPSPQPIPATTTSATSTTFTPSPEFKFSFSANIPPPANASSSTTAFTAATNEPNYVKVREIYREVDREEDEEDDDDDEEEEEQGEQEEPKAEQDQKQYDPHLNHRRILPLPKPRLKKSGNIPTTTVINNNHTTTTTLTETTTIPDTMHLDKCTDDQKPDNKRKERNWKDNFTSHPIIPPPPPLPVAAEFKKPEKPSSSTTPVAVVAVEKKKAAAAAASISTKKKKGKGLAEDSLLSKQQQQRTKTKNRQKKEDMAPGGFLSSDINLFQNPIPDDWICLFCQYDILFGGLTEARKKNGYYRRKKERSRRAREAEVRRMGSLCYSDTEHDT